MSEKFLCVNPFITERLQQTYPRRKDKIDTLWTWVNTDIFKPQLWPLHSSPFQIVFAGRLDEFKDPPLMFRTIERLRQRLNGDVRFHYIGTSDPHRFEEFAAIEDITVRHGFMDAAGMAETLASAHAGILTSEFEGMPRCVLETLAVGRPVVAMHLPQLEPVIHPGVSGYLVARSGSPRRHGRCARPAVRRCPERHRGGRDEPGTDRRHPSGRSPPAPSSRGCSAIIRKFRMRAGLAAAAPTY